MMHENMNQVIAQVNAVSFNQSNAECGCFASNNFDGKVDVGAVEDSTCAAEPTTMLSAGASLVPAADLARLPEYLHPPAGGVMP
jgi:hypothetical protein